MIGTKEREKQNELTEETDDDEIQKEETEDENEKESDENGSEEDQNESDHRLLVSLSMFYILFLFL